MERREACSYLTFRFPCARLDILVHVVRVLLQPIIGSLPGADAVPSSPQNRRSLRLSEHLYFGAQLGSSRHSQLRDVPDRQSLRLDRWSSCRPWHLCDRKWSCRVIPGTEPADRSSLLATACRKKVQCSEWLKSAAAQNGVAQLQLIHIG